MEQPAPKTCPRCQGAFECGLSNGHETCWCFECPRVLPVVEDAECLCPDCLQAEIAARRNESWAIPPEQQDPRPK